MEYITEGSHTERSGNEFSTSYRSEGRLWKAAGAYSRRRDFTRRRRTKSPLSKIQTHTGSDTLAQTTSYPREPSRRISAASTLGSNTTRLESTNNKTSPEKSQVHTVSTGRGDAHFQPIFTHCIPWSAQQPRRNLPAQTEENPHTGWLSHPSIQHTTRRRRHLG